MKVYKIMVNGYWKCFCFSKVNFSNQPEEDTFIWISEKWNGLHLHERNLTHLNENILTIALNTSLHEVIDEIIVLLACHSLLPQPYVQGVVQQLLQVQYLV